MTSMSRITKATWKEREDGWMDLNDQNFYTNRRGNLGEREKDVRIGRKVKRSYISKQIAFFVGRLA